MTGPFTPQERARKAVQALAKLYPETTCPLEHRSPLELLVATILSAQCTDKRVNLVTPALFQRYPTVHDFAGANLRELQSYIKTTGFFRNKARNIRACCRDLVARFGGTVPDRLDDLVQLPGVGRKTANVVLGAAFGKPGLPVDTHVGRLSRRLGLTTEHDPVKVERALMALVPERHWTHLSLRLIFHGRQVCSARAPRCSTCTLNTICPRAGVTKSA